MLFYALPAACRRPSRACASRFPSAAEIADCCFRFQRFSVQTVHPDLPKTDIPFERLLSQPYLAGSPPSDVRWAKDNHHIAFRWNPAGNRLRDIYVMDVPNGKPVRLTDGAKIPRMARQDDERTAEQKRKKFSTTRGRERPSGRRTAKPFCSATGAIFSRWEWTAKPNRAGARC